MQHGVFESGDIQLLHIPSEDAHKLLNFVQHLPKAEFLPQFPLKSQQENKPSANNSLEGKGVTTLTQWLASINLVEYVEFFKSVKSFVFKIAFDYFYIYFSKHLYNTIDSVCGVWDVELQTVLEINKLGHRRRILQSLAYIRHMREPKSAKTPLGENNETNKMIRNGVAREPPSSGMPAQRLSISGYRKNRYVL